MGRMRSVVVAAALIAVMVGGSVSRAAAEEANHQYATDFGIGLGAVGVNLFYMPVKVVYALLGGLTGSLAYGLTGGNLTLGRSIWKPTLGGTYVVTPSMLRGREPIMFSGPTQPGEARSSAPVEEAPAPTPSASSGSYQGY